MENGKWKMAYDALNKEFNFVTVKVGHWNEVRIGGGEKCAASFVV